MILFSRFIFVLTDVVALLFGKRIPGILTERGVSPGTPVRSDTDGVPTALIIQ